MERVCRPVSGGIWETKIQNGFGAYTPCIAEGFMIGTSLCVLCCLVCYRIRMLIKGYRLQRFRLKHTHFHWLLIFLAACLSLWPILQIFLGLSVVNLHGETSIPLFEAFSLSLRSITWISTLCMFVIETKTYVTEFRWYTRFGLVYVLLAEVTLYRFMFELKSFYNRFVFETWTIYFWSQVTLSLLYVLHFPVLLPHASFKPLNDTDAENSMEYEALSGNEHTCPELQSNLLSRLLFSWISPLMSLGYQRPLLESDVWKLDTWEQSEEFHKTFWSYWEKERRKEKPSLLRNLNNSLGGRFWLGGLYKIGFDASMVVVPILLNHLLQSIQRGDPGFIGHIYVLSIVVGIIIGIICKGQFLINVQRVGFRIRGTLVSAIFYKTLRLKHEARKGFTSGKTMNLMTTDVDLIQRLSQQLHQIWSAPIIIIVCIFLLHKQLGNSSFVGSSVILLLFPIQAVAVKRMQKYTAQALRHTDKRIGLMSEILAAIDIVKCYAWESSFMLKIQAVRKEELGCFKTVMTFGCINSFLLHSVPVLVTVIAFGIYTICGGDLTPAKAFTSMSIFSVMEFPLLILPELITQVSSAVVALQRLQTFLLADELLLQPNPELNGHPFAIHIKNGNFTWNKLVLDAEQLTLSSINMEVAVGDLVAIVGRTGEGKTSLISAILGEIESVGNSETFLRGRVAYVSQVSWIFNGTVRSNILFGSPYDPVRYKRAIMASCLDRDLELFPGGDLAEIGERGINISGGQKQRLSIARAVYADADVYIFDDPLSALDAPVARKVFKLCIQEELHTKTRVLVTNQLHFLPQVNYIFLVNGGEIKEQGTYDDLMTSGSLFKGLMENAGKTENVFSTKGNELETMGLVKTYKVEHSDISKLSEENQKVNENIALIMLEEREKGIINWTVIERYQHALGGCLVVLVFLFSYTAAEVTRASSSLWLSFWTGHTNISKHGPLFYTSIYAVLSLFQVVSTLFNSLWLISCSVSASRYLHDSMLESILRAPTSFFNSTPLGRIINRFAKDIREIDCDVATLSNMFIGSAFQLCSTFVMIGIVNTSSLWSILPLFIVFHAIYLYYQSTAREVKRLDSITRSPVYSQFGEALNGLASIRAYKAYDKVAKVNQETMDNNMRFTLANIVANRWLCIRQEILGCLMLWITATIIILTSHDGNQGPFAAQMGLFLTYALNITDLIIRTLRQASSAENSLNSVERVDNYTDLEPEAPLIIEGSRPPPGWPSKGAIQFEDVVMRYRPHVPPVLCGLSVNILPSEKIGIAGRTGAGKSSMLNTLFRVVEPECGHILIDGFDICKFGLNDLRKCLSIIPQTPVLFSGTIRFNLDPFSECTDAEVWETLERAYLKEIVSRNPMCLDMEVTENGENFSVGQRQLISLARALLRRSKVLLLDEATAAVDVGTDCLIQKTIREEFKSCTMLTIAHRLNTIIDCDRILVLDAGQVKEMDTPKNLLLNEKSMFYQMVQSTGSANAEYLKGIAMGDIKIQEPTHEQALIPGCSSSLAMSVSTADSENNKEFLENSSGTLVRIHGAVKTLQDVLQGHSNAEMAEELRRHDIPTDTWWSSLQRVIQDFSARQHIPITDSDSSRNPRKSVEVDL